jgi:hypothetical protein
MFEPRDASGSGDHQEAERPYTAEQDRPESFHNLGGPQERSQ